MLDTRCCLFTFLFSAFLCVAACDFGIQGTNFTALECTWPTTLYYSHVIRSHSVPGTNDRQLILANVVLGKCKDHGARRVPKTEAIAPAGHHSVKGTEANMECCRGWIADEGRKANPNQDTIDKFQSLLDNGAEFGRQYVVNRSNQTYPAYLVTYTA